MSAEQGGFVLSYPETSEDMGDITLAAFTNVAAKRPDLSAEAQWDIAQHMIQSYSMLAAARDADLIPSITTTLVYRKYNYPFLIEILPKSELPLSGLFKPNIEE